MAKEHILKGVLLTGICVFSTIIWSPFVVMHNVAAAHGESTMNQVSHSQDYSRAHSQSMMKYIKEERVREGSGGRQRELSTRHCEAKTVA